MKYSGVAWRRGIANLDLIIASICIAFLIVITFINAILRYFFNAPLAWIDEMQMWMTIWATCYGASALFRNGGAHRNRYDRGKVFARFAKRLPMVCICSCLRRFGLSVLHKRSIRPSAASDRSSDKRNVLFTGAYLFINSGGIGNDAGEQYPNDAKANYLEQQRNAGGSVR